ALRDHELLTRLGEVRDLLVRLVKEHDGPGRDIDIDVRPVPAVLLLSHAALAVLGDVAMHVDEWQQTVQVVLDAQDHVTAPAAIAAVRATLRHILLAPEMRRAVASLTRSHIDSRSINKCHHSSSLSVKQIAAYKDTSKRHVACNVPSRHWSMHPSGSPRQQRRDDLFVQVIAQHLRAARVAELPQRLRLELADALPRHANLPADAFQRAASPIHQAVPHRDHITLAVRQRLEHRADLLAQELASGRVRRSRQLLVLDEVTEAAVLFLADRHLEAHRVLAQLQDLLDPLRRHVHRLRQLFARRLATEFLLQLAAGPEDLIDRLDHVDRDPDRPRLVGNRPADRLTDPPHRVGAELEALVMLELLHRADEPEIALLDQVEHAEPTAHVLLRHGHDQAQVRLGERHLRLAGSYLDLVPAPLLAQLALLPEALDRRVIRPWTVHRQQS